MFSSTLRIQPGEPPKSPMLSALISFFTLGGGGQIYLGQKKKGIILILITVVFYLVFCVGVITHILGTIDAYMLADKLKKGEPIGDMQWFWEN